MKIALVGPIPPPNGGMAMQTQQLERLLSEVGHEVELIAVNKQYQPKFIEKLPIIRALFRLLPYFYHLYFGIKNKDVVHLMANSGWAFHLFSRPAIIIAHWLKVPIFINYRGGKAREFFDGSWKYIKKDVEKASGILVPSLFLKEVFLVFNQQATIIPNIINMELFTYRPSKLKQDGLHVIVTRNLEAIYDNATAIRSFAMINMKYPQARLTIAGTGPLKAQLQSLSKELGIEKNIHFAGRIDRSDMADLYNSADIMINSSIIDNMPNSILEALASGVLVVSTNVGGIPYMVEDGKDAILVNPKDPKAMFNAMCSLIDNPQLAETIAQKGYDKVQAYQPNNVLPMLELVYKKVIK